MYKTHDCAQVTETLLGKEVIVCGWVNSYRTHGSIIFVDIRDRSGIVQVVFDGNSDRFSNLSSLRNEFVVRIVGKVRNRAEGMANSKMITGQIEINADELKIISECLPYPFDINDIENVDETLRLKYRYLDLRRPFMYSNIFYRHKIIKAMRDFLDEKNFLEIETPCITKSTPEGARDYLLPSRQFPGEFFALPQSPQLFKQILMIAGMEKYFQLARCFRDEDLRSDRQPEFTQLDMEMSFVESDDIMNIAEEMVAFMAKKVFDIEIKTPFKRMSYFDAMNYYGSDKPDLRYGLKFKKINEVFSTIDFNVIKSVLETDGVVKGFKVLPNRKLSRKDYDNFTKKAKFYGCPGMFYYQKLEGDFKTSIKKFLTDDIMSKLEEKFELQNDELIIFLAGENEKINPLLGKLREYFAREFSIVCTKPYDLEKMTAENLEFLWIVDFPLFEKTSDEGIKPSHHPFTAPLDNIDIVKQDPQSAMADAYDLVLNGYEIAGGSIRIHDSKTQKEIFNLLNISDKEAEERFSFFLNALKYGTPPHGGIAFGIERVMMGIFNNSNIRELIAFPKNTQGRCLLTDAPSGVDSDQLKELKLKLTNNL